MGIARKAESLRDSGKIKTKWRSSNDVLLPALVKFKYSY